MKRYSWLIILLPIAGFFIRQRLLSTPNPPANLPLMASPTSLPPAKNIYPVSRYFERLTRRKFGQKLTSRDRQQVTCGATFTGFHTGDDLEVFPNETDAPVPVISVLDSTILQASWVSGYGGLLVALADFHGKPLTLYYGHLDLSSVALKPGNKVKAGDFLGNLGEGCSAQTDSERRHLHFAVHQGSKVDVRGYVPSLDELQSWLDPAQLFQSN